MAAERTPVDKLRTDTSLLLDIKGELSVLSTHVSTILEAQRDASAGREKIYAKLEKVDDRLEQAERLAEKAHDTTARIAPIVDNLNTAHNRAVGSREAVGTMTKVLYVAIGAFFTAVGWLLNHFGPRP